MRTAASMFGALALLLSAPAAADDLDSPPEGCPRGSVGTTEHAGQWCAATTCASDADCDRAGLGRQGVHYYRGEALVCREVALCVQEEEYTLGGLRPDPAPTATRRVGRGECVGGTCPAGGECQTARRCVASGSTAAPAETPTTQNPASESTESSPSSEPESGCSVTGSSGAPAWFSLGALALLWRARRD